MGHVAPIAKLINSCPSQRKLTKSVSISTCDDRLRPCPTLLPPLSCIRGIVQPSARVDHRLRRSTPKFLLSVNGIGKPVPKALLLGVQVGAGTCRDGMTPHRHRHHVSVGIPCKRAAANTRVGVPSCFHSDEGLASLNKLPVGFVKILIEDIAPIAFVLELSLQRRPILQHLTCDRGACIRQIRSIKQVFHSLSPILLTHACWLNGSSPLKRNLARCLRRCKLLAEMVHVSGERLALLPRCLQFVSQMKMSLQL
mmetsp:Transcript_121145/g.314597  ORF Transcript_121145/g.314597 Transcript_121145/m.314597 type:complete len:254 (+) Transcript_121145:275-1036(+)